MARKKKNSKVQDYRHDEKRKNNSPIGMVSYEPKTRGYAYDPHLSPQLVWAGKPGLKSVEVEDVAWIEVEQKSISLENALRPEVVTARFFEIPAEAVMQAACVHGGSS